MAAGLSSGHFSPENEHFCRYFRLVNETGVKPLRKILENEATSRQMTVEAFLGTQQTSMRILKQRGKIQQHQFDMIYPSKGNFLVENLDISILCCIIKNTCTISAQCRAAADHIRMSRNDICHNPVTALPRLDYDTKFSKIQNVIKTLLKECQDATFETDIENEIKCIDEGPVSVSSTLKLFEQFIIAQSSVPSLEINEKLSQLMSCLHLIYESTEELKDVYTRVNKQSNLTQEHLSEVPLEQTGVNPMIETLLKQTEAVLNQKSDIVLTKQFIEAEKKLLSSGSVILSGGAGEGKTYTAYEIMRRNGQRNNCIQISNPSDVRFVDPRIIDFVFIDDIFGNHEVDESKLKSWTHVLEKLQQLVNAGALHLLIATREIVLKECKKTVEKFSMFNNTMPLCSKNLSISEKQKILSVALKSRNKQCSPEIIQECVLTLSSDLGFPYTCILFASDESFIREGVSFFKDNPLMNYESFTQLNKCKQLSLFFLWIKDATLPVALKRSTENDNILRNLSRILKYEKAIDVIYDHVDAHCKIMDGVFLTIRPDGYQFVHNTIYQAIGYHFARIGHYELIIAHSNLSFFMECISVTEFRYRSDRVFIRRELYQHIVDRIIDEVIEMKHHHELAMHPCLTRDILEILIETLKKKKRFREFFLSGVSDITKKGSGYSNYNSFLAFYLETRAKESNWFLQQVHRHLKCYVHFNMKKQCKICKMYAEACHGACRGGNVDAFKSIVQFVKSDKTLLLDAAYSGNILMYEYVIKLLGKKEVALYAKKALHISVKKQDAKMYTVIRKFGCEPDTKCVLIASKAKNSTLLKEILLDMHVSDALRENINVRNIKRTIFSMEVFSILVQVGMCPSKEDIVRSMAANKKPVESILWDLKYINKEKAHDVDYVNMQVSQFWSDLIEDPDLNEKLEEIGVLGTSTFLDKQIQKGNIETVDEVLNHMIRNKDWNPQSNFAINLLNTCFPDPPNTNMFEFLLNRGIIPSYTTLYKAISTGNIDFVKLTVNRMKEAGSFDSKHTCSKRALLQSTFSCDIYNFLVDEGIEPTAYHFLFAVECKKDTNLTTKTIENMYEMVENRKGLQTLSKDVMQMALLGALDDIDVYTCLQRGTFQLPPETLPMVSSGGSVVQVKRLIETLKDQKEWPPVGSVMEMALECSFYKPEIFNILMSEAQKEINENSNLVSAFSILFACRKQEFDKVEKCISALKRKHLWNPNDIVLKCSLLESSEDKTTCDLFIQNGVVTGDILDYTIKVGHVELQSYIMVYLTEKGDRNVIYFKTLNEDVIRSLSTYPALCSGQLLDRAVDVSDKDTVLNILNILLDTDSAFLESDASSDILNKSSDRLEIYQTLLENGFIPTVDSLFNVVKSGSLEIFKKTIELLDDKDRLSVTNDQARKLVRESLKRTSSSFYTILAQHKMKPRLEDITFAISIDNADICCFLIKDLENEEVKECHEIVDVILVKAFQLYKALCDKGLSLTSSGLLEITKSYLHRHLHHSNLSTVYSDFFSQNTWRLEDDNLSKIWQMSKNDEDLFSVLKMNIKSSQVNKLLTVLLSGANDELKTTLDNESYDINNVLPGALRCAFSTRKQLDEGCMETIFEWVDKHNCSPSFKILSSVLKLDTEGTLNILYELSPKENADLDNEILITALEEAIFMNKTEMYYSILKVCHVTPTTYCLLYSFYHNNDACVSITLKKLPALKKTCRDAYFKATLALCCQRMDRDKFNVLLNESSKDCDTELLFEAALCKDDVIFQQVKEILINNDRLDYQFRDYWISSALIEANDNPLIKNIFESHYDDALSVANGGPLTPVSERPRLDLPEQFEDLEERLYESCDESCEYYIDTESDHEYEEIDSLFLDENAYSWY